MSTKKKKTKKVAKVEKVIKNIEEYYFMIPQETCVKEISAVIKSQPEEKVEIWPELDLMEVILGNDSLIFQNAKDCFIDPLDQEFIQEQGMKTLYQISFEKNDLEAVRQVMKEILDIFGGMICSDTEDFMPIFTAENIESL